MPRSVSVPSGGRSSARRGAAARPGGEGGCGGGGGSRGAAVPARAGGRPRAGLRRRDHAPDGVGPAREDEARVGRGVAELLLKAPCRAGPDVDAVPDEPQPTPRAKREGGLVGGRAPRQRGAAPPATVPVQEERPAAVVDDGPG